MASVSVETDSCVEAFGMLKDVQREDDLVAVELMVDLFKGTLHTQPEVDLLES
ncbi:hypothetical protein DSO57_1026016 [Entomophthora muscae]|uniref:Uncharacterized protein n=1 Tax=Entomophthora muscae TaxID=34485 RepID=A0ACC2RTC4_9FUNG|nr:hypothetical protein DSO57_1026016 [Entomophthora muscae]